MESWARERLVTKPDLCVGPHEQIDFIRREHQSAVVQIGQRRQTIEHEPDPELFVRQQPTHHPFNIIAGHCTLAELQPLRLAGVTLGSRSRPTSFQPLGSRLKKARTGVAHVAWSRLSAERSICTYEDGKLAATLEQPGSDEFCFGALVAVDGVIAAEVDEVVRADMRDVARADRQAPSECGALEVWMPDHCLVDQESSSRVVKRSKVVGTYGCSVSTFCACARSTISCRVAPSASCAATVVLANTAANVLTANSHVRIRITPFAGAAESQALELVSRLVKNAASGDA
jgi:hypothetical protein